jgi:hypothetical protein
MYLEGKRTNQGFTSDGHFWRIDDHGREHWAAACHLENQESDRQGPAGEVQADWAWRRLHPREPWHPWRLERIRRGSDRAWQAPLHFNLSASGATAMAHCAIRRMWSGAAVMAVSTMAATISASALEPSMAALTTSQAQPGAAATSVATTSRTFDCSAATAVFTEAASFRQSTSAETGTRPRSGAEGRENSLFHSIGVG